MIAQGITGTHMRHVDEVQGYEPPGHWGTHNRRLVEGREAVAFEMILGEMAPDGGSERHFHIRNHQVMFILSGEAVIEAEDTAPQRCRTGSVVQIPAGIEHSVRAEGTEPLKFIVIFSPPLATEEI